MKTSETVDLQRRPCFLPQEKNLAVCSVYWAFMSFVLSNSIDRTMSVEPSQNCGCYRHPLANHEATPVPYDITRSQQQANGQQQHN
jgi:hypothetical protein